MSRATDLGATKEELTEDMVPGILDSQTHPRLVLAFDSATDGKWRNQVVRKLVDLNCAASMLGFLDRRCDRETFQRVIGAAPASNHCLDLLHKALAEMKTLGYRRTCQEFEKVILLCESWDAHTLFLEMNEECEEAASPECYERVLNICTEFKEALLVVQKAKSKGVWVDVSGFVLKKLSVRRDVPKAANLIKEGGNVDLVASKVLKELDFYTLDFFEEVVRVGGNQLPYPKSCEAFFCRQRAPANLCNAANILVSLLMLEEIDKETCIKIVKFLIEGGISGEATILYETFSQHFEGSTQEVIDIRQKLKKP